MLKDLVLSNRSYRRFRENEAVSLESLRELVDLARLTPSGGNQQSLKYYIACDPQKNAVIYPSLAWAGYLKDWDGPAVGERPAAYIIIFGDKSISTNFGCDYGIAAQTIMLGATEKGLGGCMIGSVKRPALMHALGIDSERFDLLLVLALGKPNETVILEQLSASSDIRYWRDSDGNHHVPKRYLDDIILD